MPRYKNRSKLNSKTLTTRDQAESLKKKVYSILDKANSEFSAERRVSRRAATLVVKKSLKTTLGLQHSLREHRALKSLSEFLNFSQTGKMVSKSVEEFTDLLPMGHPESTKKHSMTASAFANARLLWVLADPRISEEAKPLVASVLVDAKDSPSYLYALTRLEYDTDSALPLQALIAAYGGGNSREARSARARLQRRDKYGRFAFQGGGLSVNVRRSNGNINRLTGRTVADTPNSSIIETPDGKIYSINEDSEGQLPGEYVKAILENTPDGISPVPAIVKTGDPVVDEKDLVTLEVPPGFKKDESYKGVGTKYTDDAYDVIKFDNPSTQTRDRIGAAVKYATANDLLEIDQKKKGEDGKIWNQDKPIFEISRRGGKAFAFTQSWADTQESIEVDEPRLDALEGRTPEPSRDEKLKTIQARLDAGDNLTDILPDIFDSPKKKKSKTQEPASPPSSPPPPTPPKSTQTPEPEPEEPAKPEISKEEFSWKVPTGGYLLATDSEYDPEGRTDQESKDYTDDPDIVGNKFSTGELVQGLEQALTSPDLIDSQETTDLIDQIRSDDEADGISTDELDDNYEPTPEEIAEQEEILKKVKNRKVNNLATGYGSLSFSGGEELVPAEAIYFALKAQGEDADKIVARIYDNASGGTENIDALNASRGNVVETTVPDIADIIDSPSEDGVDPSADPWDPESYELAALRKDLSNGFDESDAYNAERNGFIFESDSATGDISINVIEGRDRSKVATIKEDGSLEWNTKNDLREAQDLQNDYGQDLWDTFVEYSNDESINLPAAMRNMTQEQIDKYAKDNEHFDFLKENDFYGDYTQVGLHDISSDSFDNWTDVGDMPEYPYASNNPVHLAQVLDTDSLIQGFQIAMSNKKDGTSPITYTDDNGEDVEFDIPAEAWRDALQLQGVDTDEILFEMFISNDLNFNAEETEYGFRSLDEARAKASSEARDALKTQKAKETESTETLLTTVNSVENQNASTPPAEELPVPQRGFVRTVDLKPGDVSVKDGFVITEIGRDQIVGKNGAMRKVKGYFPGHQEQDTKQWYEDTPIEVYRGIPIPPKGDLPPLSKTTVKQGRMKQEDYDKSLATARGLVQEPEIVMPINDLKTGKDDSVEELPTDTVDAPEKTTAPKSFNRVKYPTFQGRFAQLVRDAEGDPEEFKKLLDQEEYTIFDYETTGLDVNNPEHNPIQISAIKVKNGEVVDSFNAFMNPDAPLSEWNLSKSVDTDGNPITQEWVDSQQSRADAHKQFSEWLGDNPMLAGFNVGFDEGFLKANSDEAGLTYSPSGVMDVLALGRSSLWGDKTRPTKKDENGQIIINEYGTAVYDNTLKVLSDYLGVNLDNWHDSRSDVEATKGVFEGMIQKSIENKDNKRKLSSFDVDARLAEYEKSLAALDVANVDKNPVVDSIESANVGAPDPNAQEIIGSDKDSALDENVDPYISIPSNKVLPGDIAIRPNEAFIVVAIVPDPENKGKVIVNGYYPGHEIQEKTWNGDTVINIVRGIPESDLPKSGDDASIERPVRLGAYKSGNSQFDRDDAIHTAKKYKASSVYSRNPLNNRDIARDRENIKTTNPNTQEGRTNDWIRNNQNTANIVGARVTDLREGDYVRLTLPEDPLVYGYINKIEFDDVKEKATIYFVNTNNGEISSREWRFKAGMNDVRRTLRDQEKSDIRPLDLNIEGVDPVASDGKTPIKPNDTVSDNTTGISGDVVGVTNITGSNDADKRKSKLISVKNSDGDTHLLDPNKVSNITDEPYVYRDIDAEFERQRDERDDRMSQAPPSVDQAEFITEDVAKTYEKSPLNGSKNHDVYLFFGNNKFARGSKIETDNGNILLTISGYSNPVSYPYGDIKSIAITPKRGASSSDSINQEAPSDETSYRKSDKKVDSLRVGDLLPAYFPTRGGEDRLLKQRDKDPNYEMPPVDRIVGLKYINYSKSMKKASITVKNIETGKERTFEVNLGANIYDVRTPIRTPQTPESQPQSGDLLESNPNSEDSGKKKGFTAEEKKDWKDNKVDGIVSSVVDSIIASLDKGEIPWQKGWSGGSFFPKNVFTGNDYKGINIFILMLAQEKSGYTSNRWVGEKQAEKIGGKLKPDQSGTEIMVPKIIKVKVKQKDGTEKEEPRVVGFGFNRVYNIDQFDGLNVSEETPREPVSVLDAENRILELYKDKPEIRFIEMSASQSPNWSPSADVITLPKREQFDSSEQLLETLIHELAHSTGHPSRLNRSELIDNYSTHRASRGEEELIADMTAAMVASHLGVDINLENTAAYVQSWLKSLQNDRSFILKAATSASKAMEYMLGSTPNRGTNKPESNSDTPAPNTPDDDFKQAPSSGSNSPSMGKALPDMGAEIYDMAPLSEEGSTVPNAFQEDNYEYTGEKFPPTAEQRDVLTAIMTGDNVVVRALAGTGKTSTLTLAARRLFEEDPKKKIVYVAFNKTVQMEAQEKMPSNVESRTGDSIAFQGVAADIIKKFKDQREKRATMKLRAEDIAEELEIMATSVKMDGSVVKISSQEIPLYIKQAVNNFAISADDVLGAKHFSEELDEVPRSFVEYANAYWDDITSPSGVFGINNAHITKIWALSNPDLGAVGSGLKTPADVIFFDEAQDINPVIAKVIADQTIQKVYVGDGNQAIYAFRGAEDQLDKTTATWDLPLTKSFRFGPEIAGIANRFLAQLGSKYRVEGAGSKGEVVDEMKNPDVLITRTNSGGFRAMIELLDAGKVVGITEGTKDELESLVNSASWLIGDQTKFKKPTMHPDLAEFRNWSEVKKAVEKGEGKKVKALYDLVVQNGIGSIKDILKKVKVVTPKSEKKDLKPSTDFKKLTLDQVEDGAKGLIGNEINYEVEGNAIRLSGKGTFKGKDTIKDQKFRWDPTGKQWFKEVEDGLDRQKEINDLRRSVGGFAPDEGEEEPEIDVIVTTAHKSKGLQWDNVRIFDDFWGPRMNKKTGEVEMPVDEELRLAYVALTRAQKKLDPGPLNWILDYTKNADELPKKPNLGQQGNTGEEIAKEKEGSESWRLSENFPDLLTLGAFDEESEYESALERYSARYGVDKEGKLVGVETFEHDALSSYSGGGYKRINAYHRNFSVGKSYSPSIQQNTAGLDSLIENAPDMFGNTTLFRVVDNLVLEKLSPGDIFQDEGFLSTTRIDLTRDIDTRNEFSKISEETTPDTVLVILPSPSKSGKGVAVDLYLTSVVNTSSLSDKEKEVLLPRNTVLKFLGYRAGVGYEGKVAVFERMDK